MQKLAYGLIGISLSGLMIWGFVEFFKDSSVPLILKIAIIALTLGFLLLLGIAIKDRIKKSREEDFKGVEK